MSLWAHPYLDCWDLEWFLFSYVLLFSNFFFKKHITSSSKCYFIVLKDKCVVSEYSWENSSFDAIIQCNILELAS